MGALDIFKTTFDKNTGWTNVENLRAPINSIGNDMSIVFDDPYHGFLVSDRINGTGAADIYSFSKTGPREVIYDGKKLLVRDFSMFDDIKTSISAKDLSGKKIKFNPISENGYFIIDSIIPEVKYKVKFKKDGFSHSYFYFTVNRDGAQHKLSIKNGSTDLNLKGKVGEYAPFFNPLDSNTVASNGLKISNGKKKRPRLVNLTMDKIREPIVKENKDGENFIPYPGVKAKLKKGKDVIQNETSDLDGVYSFFIEHKKKLVIEIDTIPDNYKEISDSLANQLAQKDSI
jgi:hypothetical protein